MTTLLIEAITTPDGILPRCPTLSGWRPSPVAELTAGERARLEKSLRGHQTRHTRIEWFAMPSPSIEGLGWP